jgi:hypothetical protein
VLLLVIGAGLLAWGSPYYMLDWGGTLVIAGSVLASAGLICLLLGVALQRLSALRSDIMMLRAADAVDAAPSGRAVDGLEREPVLSEAAREPLAEAQPADQRSVQVPASGVPTGAVLAGGLAAGGLAVAAKSILSAVAPDPASGASDADSAIMAIPETVVAADREHALSGTREIAADLALPPRAAPNSPAKRVAHGTATRRSRMTGSCQRPAVGVLFGSSASSANVRVWRSPARTSTGRSRRE